MASEKVARYFAPQEGDTSFIPGVPARDLTEAEYEELAPWQQASVDARESAYRKTKPQAEKPQVQASEPAAAPAPKPKKATATTKQQPTAKTAPPVVEQPAAEVAVVEAPSEGGAAKEGEE
jgi:hypothetical protein